MPRICTVCIHPKRAAIEAQMAAGHSIRGISRRYRGISDDAIQRHKAHIRKAIRRAEEQRELNTVQAVLDRMGELYARVSSLVDRLEDGTDHRVTLSGMRELRESLRAIHDMLAGAELERRVRELELCGSGRVPDFVVQVVSDKAA